MSKWQAKKIHAMQTLEYMGEAWVKRDDVIALITRKCGDCKFFEDTGKKKTLCKCINPTYHQRKEWKWCSAAGNACQKFTRRSN